VSRTSPARYQQLAHELAGEIETGKYDGTGQLPSLKALAHRSGLSLSSVVRSVDILKHDGLVHSVPGVGLFVSGRP
jgi:DNA-binding GntR family transcriptional regulator